MSIIRIRKTISRTAFEITLNFSSTSTEKPYDKLRRIILNDCTNLKKIPNDEKFHDKQQQARQKESKKKFNVNLIVKTCFFCIIEVWQDRITISCHRFLNRGVKVQNDSKQTQDTKAKRTAKNSVFLDLFQNKSYLLKLYKTLHPEDDEATEDSLTDVTIENVLTDNLYNDLGFIVNNKLMILIEAQSTWTMNILVRVLLYLAQSYHEYFQRTSQNYYKSRKVKMPKPELYVIFTGNRGRKPDKISLSKEFFEDADIDIEVNAKVIYESDTEDIINQYIIFCKVFNEQTKQHGMTRKAVTETIRICKNRNVLMEYLLDREKEVVTIMMSLFDEEQIMKSFIRSERVEEARENARIMLKNGRITVEEIPNFFPKLTLEDARELEAEVMQLA